MLERYMMADALCAFFFSSSQTHLRQLCLRLYSFSRDYRYCWRNKRVVVVERERENQGLQGDTRTTSYKMEWYEEVCITSFDVTEEGESAKRQTHPPSGKRRSIPFNGAASVGIGPASLGHARYTTVRRGIPETTRNPCD